MKELGELLGQWASRGAGREACTESMETLHPFLHTSAFASPPSGCSWVVLFSKKGIIVSKVLFWAPQNFEPFKNIIKHEKGVVETSDL